MFEILLYLFILFCLWNVIAFVITIENRWDNDDKEDPISVKWNKDQGD